jgi:hypothetical protein
MKINIGRYFQNGKKRKVNIKIDPYDTWSMDDTLALIIHPMLVQLKATKHGASNVADEDVPENLRTSSAPPTGNDWDVDVFYFDRWDWVLDEMIWAFKQKIDKKSFQPRMINGFRLFGKYYEALWD